ncbi:MAG: NAD(P)H-dependent oxidoreductase [Gammaproteobacteria bacterium]|nr:NAD(P)H-dependent oxidoreductase [Gammaproteobacteria bacterium]MCW8888602.1 NAD(P)H-dependent oxidoreductase [Gammaproteobacteria bacterium]MCW8983016.1 NAD(P)H-dependent oxidoreductase [Gammaproteobacteria bacterium]
MILLQLVHPHMDRSRANRAMLDAISDVPGLLVNDLYEHYPDFYIDRAREQELLCSADLVIFQFPIYWYAAPALLKQWQEMVLLSGFAHGKGGDALQGKRLFTAVTTGQPFESYSGSLSTIDELLSPYCRTAIHCGMKYLPPFVVHNVDAMSDIDIVEQAKRYREQVVTTYEQMHAGTL